MSKRIIFAVSTVAAVMLIAALLSAQPAGAQAKDAPKATPPNVPTKPQATPAITPPTAPATPAAPKPPAENAAARPAPQATTQEDLFKINMAAYKGIMFLGFFGLPPYTGRDDIPEPAPVQIAPKDERVALSLAGLFTQMQNNLIDFKKKAATPSQKVLLGGDGAPGIITIVGDTLKAVNADAAVAQIRIRRLYFSGATASNALAEVVKKFGDLDKAGIALPWLDVVQSNMSQTLQALLHNPRFLQRLGRCTFDDLFTRSSADPLVDDELLDLVADARAAHVFGKLCDYSAKATDTCCDRTKRICVTGPTCNCWTNIATGKCSIASQFCP